MTRLRQRSSTSVDTEKLGSSWVPGSPIPPQVYWCSSPYRERVTDEKHKMKKTRHGAVWRNGGPFILNRIAIKRSNSANLNLYTGLRRWSGSFCQGSLGNNPTLGLYISDPQSLVGMGATGIARAKPGQPTHGLGQAIAELRKLPSIPSIRKAVKSLSGLGSQYLNLEFGWKPLLNDALSLLDLQIKLDKQLKQLRRDNGRAVRRRLTLKRTDSKTVTTFTDGICRLYPILTDDFYNQGVTSQQRFTTYRMVENYSRYWFSGRFRYWIPDINSENYAIRAKLRLADVIPTPKLVWELMPWSWLIDWFTNVGDVIDNMSANAAENLTLEYGYVMGTIAEDVTYGSSALLFNNQRVYASVTLENVMKRRTKAYPFGFSVDPPDLSIRQMAILAALGLSSRQSSR